MSGFRSASALVLVLIAGSVADRASAQTLTSGTVSLELAGEGYPTTLSADWFSLHSALCGESDLRGGGADCRLTAGDQLPLDPHELSIEYFAIPEKARNAPAVLFVPSDLLLRGTGLVTACGTWSWTLDLDPEVRQPVSKVVLLPHPDEPISGVTSGHLDIAGRLRFVNERSERAVLLPWNVSLDFVTRWRIDESIRDGSTLQLFTDPVGIAAPACLTEIQKCGRWNLRPTERLPGKPE